MSRASRPVRSTMTTDDAPVAPEARRLLAPTAGWAGFWRITAIASRHLSTVGECARLHPVTTPSTIAAAAVYSDRRAVTIRPGCGGAVTVTGGVGEPGSV